MRADPALPRTWRLSPAAAVRDSRVRGLFLHGMSVAAARVRLFSMHEGCRKGCECVARSSLPQCHDAAQS